MKFPQANRTYSAPSELDRGRGRAPLATDIATLPAFYNGSTVTSLWRPTWWERLSILLFGRVWLVTIGQRPQPAALHGRRTVFEREPAKRLSEVRR